MRGLQEIPGAMTSRSCLGVRAGAVPLVGVPTTRSPKNMVAIRATTVYYSTSPEDECLEGWKL